MPTYTFRLPARFASTPVTVYNTADVQQTTGTTDSNAVFTASLSTGDYYAKISYGYTSYRAAGEVDRGDSDATSPEGLSATFASVFKPEKYGAAGNGTTDDSAAIAAALAAIHAAGGGTLMLTAGKVYKCLSAIVPPVDGSGMQKPIRITSNAIAFCSDLGGDPVNGGAVLDIRYDGTDTLHPAKIDARGHGPLEIDRVVIRSGGTDNLRLFQSTNATVQIHDNAFVGNMANSGNTCQQDAIVLGGLDGTAGSGPASAFQGYGSTIERNYFSHIRRGVLLQAWANSTITRENTFWTTCGSNLPIAAAIEINPGTTPGSFARSNIVDDNLIEVPGYKYGVACLNGTSRNTFRGNSMWDNTGAYVADYYFDATSSGNTVINDLEGTLAVQDLNGGNHVFDRNGNMRGGWKFTANTTSQTPLAVQQITSQVGDLMVFLKADGSTTTWTVDKDGALRCTTGLGGTTPIFVNNNTASGPAAEFRNQFRGGVRLGDGGNPSVMTFTNGSGTVQCGFFVGGGTPEGSKTANVGSIYLRTDGAAATTLYIKETGTGNTGWVAK